MPTPVALLARRLTAGVALVALPLGAAVGCGTAASAKKDSVQTTLQKASDNLKASRSASFTLHLSDPKGSLKKASTSGTDPLSPAVADLLVGGTVSFTVAPANGKTLGDLQTSGSTASPADQLKRVNVAMSVQADGGPVAQLRLVGGDLYAQVGIATISDIAKKSGSTTDVAGQLDALAAQAPAQFGPIIADVKAGKWLKLPLAPYAASLGKLAQPSATPSVDTTKLGMDLIAAVRPYVAVTDASSSGSTRVLDVKVQAKQALKAVLTTVQSMNPALPGLSTLNTSGIDKIGDGTLNGQVTLNSDHLRKLTLDLTSAAALAPAGSTPAPDLSGSTLTIDVDDSAGDVTVPDNVSSADIASLVSGALSGLSGLGGTTGLGLTGGATTS